MSVAESLKRLECGGSGTRGRCVAELFRSVVYAKTEVGWLLAVYDKRARRPVSGAEYQPFVRLRVRDLSMF